MTNLRAVEIGDYASIDAPMPTQTSHAGHIYVADPVIFNGRKNNKAKGVSTEPVPTLDTKGGIWLAGPFIATVAHGNDADELSPNGQRAQSIELPLGTIHAGGGKYAVVEPFILNRHGEGYGETRAHSVEEPTPTANCRGAGYLIEPFVLSRHGEGAPRSIEEPTPTQVARHSHCLISPYYGTGSGETCNSVEEPLPTVTSKGRFGMVVPITHSDSSNRARDVDTDPLPTLTTAHRGEQALVEGTAQYDILFRMLEPHELAAAMGFNGDEVAYEFAGTKTEKVKQIGNAVSVSKMKACVAAIMADAAKPAIKKPEATRRAVA